MNYHNLIQDYTKLKKHYEHYSSISECLEDAAEKQISLDGLDFGNLNLTNINLDGINISNSSFKGTNLNGANLSEAYFSNCNFSESSLCDTCFCYSQINHCDFRYCRFGATDVAGATLQNCQFAGTSCFSNKFRYTDKMTECTYEHSDEKLYEMSSPPVSIEGLEHSIVILENHVIIAGNIINMNFLKSSLLHSDKDFFINKNCHLNLESIIDLLKTRKGNCFHKKY